MTASQSTFANVFRDFVDLNFARRLEMAETITSARVRMLQRSAPDATSEMFAGGTAAFGGATCPSNQIVSMGLYGAVTSAELDGVEEFYRSRGVACQIVVSPLADRSLLELLAPRNYQITEFNSALIRRLEVCEFVEPAQRITIERVHAETAKLWDRVIAKGFAEYGAVPENLFAPSALLPDSLNFLARADGEPAGGGMGAIMRDSGIAALFGSATLPEFRGCGVQTALIHRRLWEAAQAGAEYAVVSTLPGSGSQRNMERRGFRVAYTKIVMVKTWPEQLAAGVSDGH